MRRFLAGTIGFAAATFPTVGNAADGDASVPISMRECEATNHSCGDWVFKDRIGRGVWYDGAYAELKVDYIDSDKIVITRTDSDGRSRGLTARYTGQFDGNRVHGSVVWSWPAAWGNTKPTGEWEATFEHLSPDEALERGREAAAQGDTIEAKRWLYEAAQGGNQEANGRIDQTMRGPTGPAGGIDPALNGMLNQMYMQFLQQEAACQASPACMAERQAGENDQLTKDAQAADEQRRQEATDQQLMRSNGTDPWQ
jgi:hypothetical protein